MDNCFSRFILLSILFLSQFGFGQNFQKADLLLDLNYMDSAFQYGHPSNLAFNEKLNFQHKIKEVTSVLPETITKLQYENAVREVLMEVKCLHTSYVGWDNKRPKAESTEKYFPYFVYTDGEKIWINDKVNDSVPSILEFGNELVSINGSKTDYLLSILMNTHPDDGAGRQINKYIINTYFPQSLIKCIPNDSVFTVITKDFSGQEKTSKVEACAFAPKKEVDATVLIEGNQSYYSSLNNSLGYLRIKSFQAGENSFYEKVFQNISDSNVQTLILDLRNNPGGNLYTCKDLLSFLLSDTSQFSMTYPKENMRSFLPWKNRRKLRVQNFILRYLKSDSYEKTDITKVYTQKIFPDTKLGFKGELYVLTNELTASGASFVSTFARHHRESTLIGQTTGGGEYWLNAAPGNYPLLELPKSGILIQTSTHYIHFDFPVEHFNGITPDILLDYDGSTFGKRDLEMEKVFELIGNQ
ncbi:MAG: S41 family peptidase [Bacteroidota bacterium]